jgi:hypothetical protein
LLSSAANFITFTHRRPNDRNRVYPRTFADVSGLSSVGGDLRIDSEILKCEALCPIIGSYSPARRVGLVAREAIGQARPAPLRACA